jgi:hypothetical protein
MSKLIPLQGDGREAARGRAYFVFFVVKKNFFNTT